VFLDGLSNKTKSEPLAQPQVEIRKTDFCYFLGLHAPVSLFKREIGRRRSEDFLHNFSTRIQKGENGAANAGSVKHENMGVWVFQGRFEV
jgi:hypothetical protein